MVSLPQPSTCARCVVVRRTARLCHTISDWKTEQKTMNEPAAGNAPWHPSGMQMKKGEKDSFIETLDGGKTEDFSPRKLLCNHEWVRRQGGDMRSIIYA